MTPETPSSATMGNRICERVTARSCCSPSKPNGRITSGATSMNSAVRAPRPRRRSQKSVEATRQARARSPFSSSSEKTGTNAAVSAWSATRLRTRFGTWKAAVNALIPAPSTPK